MSCHTRHKQSRQGELERGRGRRFTACGSRIHQNATIDYPFEGFSIEAFGRKLWLAMNPRCGPSAHPAFASGYGGQAAGGYM